MEHLDEKAIHVVKAGKAFENAKCFPAKLELSGRKPEGFELSDGQKYIPVIAGLGRHSLSAILLDDAYFGLIQTRHDERDRLWVANATALIPLKAHAWINLTKTKAAGEEIDSRTSRNTGRTSSASLPLSRAKQDRS